MRHAPNCGEPPLGHRRWAPCAGLLGVHREGLQLGAGQALTPTLKLLTLTLAPAPALTLTPTLAPTLHGEGPQLGAGPGACSSALTLSLPLAFNPTPGP